jgi:hypothetical protein
MCCISHTPFCSGSYTVVYQSTSLESQNMFVLYMGKLPDGSEKYYTQYNSTTQILELQIYHKILLYFSTHFQFATLLWTLPILYYLHTHAKTLAKGQCSHHIDITILHMNKISCQKFNYIYKKCDYHFTHTGH